MSAPSPQNTNWYPPLSDKVDWDTQRAFRIAFDNLYELRDQTNSSNSATVAGLATLSTKVSKLSLDVTTKKIQYKDWAGNNQSIVVVTSVTLKGV